LVVKILILLCIYFTTVRTRTELTETLEDDTVNDYTLTGGDVTQERMSNHPPSTKGVSEILSSEIDYDKR
jgi:hypothetical protein